MSSESIVKPVYQKIAIDIANRIVARDFNVGDKLYGRSSLASQYNVSPETIRRATILLSDMGIVKVTKGSGIIIESVDNCLKFIDKFKDIDSMTSLKKEITGLMAKRRQLDKSMENITNELIDYSNRFNKSNPFTPFEFEIYAGLHIIGKAISEVKFWQNTGATIIAIRRNGKLILSPGPYTVFMENDVFIAIGDESTYYRTKKFLYDK
ncbi:MULTISPECIES: TrkA C-terminal domain-containing protein [Clostridium]|jgi:K+/H+ antiporter YhaU regulatory subunit KhtT|uniref:TrkA C-terminal domain-containing protein n=1 Tax=Clostridium TaxID=1485 RepID=UPI000288D5DB|nr:MULTISPECIES: TrkA C-terminal domain-containing protein [Clostridium]MDF2504481.1 transcriptional regulator, GntR family [Clostridium sp.]